MELFDIGFVTVRLVDILDISLVSLLIYNLYRNIRGRLALRIMSLVISVFLVWKLVDLLDFRLLGSILDEFLSLGAVALVIIFAPEIRSFLSAISKNTLFDRIVRQVSSGSVSDETYREVVDALKSLRATGNGALIIFTGSDPLNEIQETGDRLNSTIAARLIYTIFQKESPLHDGAMILHDDRIAAVRCILPISKSTELDPELGLRHRSALGITEQSDTLAIIVSEERREVSLAYRGKLKRNVDYHEVEDAIKNHYQQMVA